MCENTDKGIINARASVIDAFIGNKDSSKGVTGQPSYRKDF